MLVESGKPVESEGYTWAPRTGDTVNPITTVDYLPNSRFCSVNTISGI